MCMKVKTPKVPPAPRVTTPEEAAIKAERETRDRLRGRGGRRATILTSALGDPSFGAAARQRDLLSGGSGQ